METWELRRMCKRKESHSYFPLIATHPKLIQFHVLYLFFFFIFWGGEIISQLNINILSSKKIFCAFFISFLFFFVHSCSCSFLFFYKVAKLKILFYFRKCGKFHQPRKRILFHFKEFNVSWNDIFFILHTRKFE